MSKPMIERAAGPSSDARAALGVLVALLVGSCSEPAKTAGRPSPEITAGAEEGMVDLTFAIQTHEKSPDGSQTLQVSGTHRGRDVGLTVVLGSKWAKEELGTDVKLVTHVGTAAIRSAGVRTDALIQILDELYETKQYPTKMRPDAKFSATSIEGDPTALAKGPAKLKLFVESDDETRRAEFYVNIDLKTWSLAILEKDPAYRGALIRALKAD